MKPLDLRAILELDEASGNAEFFELALDHLCVAGFDGYWKRLNSAWTRTLGWTPEELMSRPLIEFCHPDDREMTLAGRAQLIDGEPLRMMVNRYLCKDGSYRWLEWRSVSNVERKLVYAIARDVTAEREARSALEELQRKLAVADRMASIGTLAAGVAHEINNPLAVVTANLEMILDESRTRTAAEYTDMAREAAQGAERIRKIVRGLQTFSRVKEERRTPFDLKVTLELAIEMTSNEIRHRARLVKQLGDVPLVEADESGLGQVFINILLNAAQAIAEGNFEGNEITVVTATDVEGHAVVEVRDTGPGIPSDVLGKIFDPFFTTKPVGAGTGLGLSIAHNIVAGLGGQITAANGESRGAVFRVTLPPAAARPAAPAPATGAAPTPGTVARRARVLVIDDERSVGAILKRMLREHDVTPVTSGPEALALLAAGSAFDVILSDVMMPEMSGIELHGEIERRFPALVKRLVFMTGGAFTAEVTEFLDQSPSERLDKPFAVAQVRAVIERIAR